MPVLVESIEQIYCEHCNLATPTWRKRCIHCKVVLSLKSKEKRIARNYSPANANGYESRFTPQRFQDAA